MRMSSKLKKKTTVLGKESNKIWPTCRFWKRFQKTNPTEFRSADGSPFSYNQRNLSGSRKLGKQLRRNWERNNGPRIPEERSIMCSAYYIFEMKFWLYLSTIHFYTHVQGIYSLEKMRLWKLVNNCRKPSIGRFFSAYNWMIFSFA